METQPFQPIKVTPTRKVPATPQPTQTQKPKVDAKALEKLWSALFPHTPQISHGSVIIFAGKLKSLEVHTMTSSQPELDPVAIDLVQLGDMLATNSPDYYTTSNYRSMLSAMKQINDVFTNQCLRDPVVVNQEVASNSKLAKTVIVMASDSQLVETFWRCAKRMISQLVNACGLVYTSLHPAWSFDLQQVFLVRDLKNDFSILDANDLTCTDVIEHYVSVGAL